MINPKYLSTPKTAFDERKINYTYAKCYKANDFVAGKNLIREAVDLSNRFDTIIVFAGLTDYAESKGGDRKDMRLPENLLALIEALIKEDNKVIVILFGGSHVELPLADSVNGILNMYLPGQNGGDAMEGTALG